VGACVDRIVGILDGMLDGNCDGRKVLVATGERLGFNVGTPSGVLEVAEEGVVDGYLLGVLVGETDVV